MAKITKPMLAAALERFEDVVFPVLATPKLDGIRCIIKDGRALSRKFKEIPNRHMQKLLSTLPDGLDGELVCPAVSFNGIQSLVMSEDGEPVFLYLVFDYVKDDTAKGYADRIADLQALPLQSLFVKYLIPTEYKTPESLAAYEAECVAAGYEGIIIRSPNGPYKCGRSTLKEGYLLKFKRFLDSEAKVLGFEEKLHNDNELTTDELGHAKRSSHKENLVPADTLGAFLVKDIKTGIEFKIGTGMDDELRKLVWDNRASYLGKIVNYQHQGSGAKDKPRFPSFRGFRDIRDLD